MCLIYLPECEGRGGGVLCCTGILCGSMSHYIKCKAVSLQPYIIHWFAFIKKHLENYFKSLGDSNLITWCTESPPHDLGQTWHSGFTLIQFQLNYYQFAHEGTTCIVIQYIQWNIFFINVCQYFKNACLHIKLLMYLLNLHSSSLYIHVQFSAGNSQCTAREPGAGAPEQSGPKAAWVAHGDSANSGRNCRSWPHEVSTRIKTVLVQVWQLQGW
jgi:hypothetical protein